MAFSGRNRAAPGAEALLPDGPPSVQRANPRRPIGFSAWKPPR